MLNIYNTREIPNPTNDGSKCYEYYDGNERYLAIKIWHLKSNGCWHNETGPARIVYDKDGNKIEELYCLY